MENIKDAKFVVSDIYFANRVKVTNVDKYISYRNRRYHGFAYKVSGVTNYYFGDKKIVSKPGTIIYFPKNSNYKFVSENFGECIAVNFDTVNELDLPPFICKFKNTETIQTNFELIAKKYNASFSEFNHECMSILYKIISMVQNNLISEYMHSNKIEIISPAVEYIKKNLASDINITYLAQISKISETYFRRLFTKIYGVSPIKYINTLRLRKSVELLLGTDYSIGKIAKDVGYSDQYYYCKIFKKHYGESPFEFRKKNF